MYRKATKFSVRNYNAEKIRYLRKIPNEEVRETLKFVAKTYLGVNVGNIENRYKTFRI